MGGLDNATGRDGGGATGIVRGRAVRNADQEGETKGILEAGLVIYADPMSDAE